MASAGIPLGITGSEVSFEHFMFSLFVIEQEIYKPPLVLWMAQMS